MDETKKHRQNPALFKGKAEQEKIRFPGQIKKTPEQSGGKDILTMKSLILAQDER